VNSEPTIVDPRLRPGLAARRAPHHAGPGRLARVLVAALFLGTLAAAGAAAGLATSTLPAGAPEPTLASAPPSEAPPTLGSELDQARAVLARLQQQADAGAPLPLLEEQRNLTARLVLLLAAEQRRSATGNEPAHAFAGAAEPAPLGAPPYPVAAVDALRDQHDSLLAQRQSLEVSARALEVQVSTLLAARRKAEEAWRLRQDQLARAREPDARDRLSAEAEVARLEARIAGIELARADGDRAAARDRIEALAAQAGQVGREVDHARPHQLLDDDALAEVAAAVRSARQALAGQRRSLEARLSARERAAARSGSSPAAAREVAALRARLDVLAELDKIEAGREEVWSQRRLALAAAGDDAAADEARAVLGRSIEQLGLRAQATGERLALARTTLRADRLRADRPSDADGADLAAERRALEAMQLHVDALETVQERLSRLQQLLQRSLDDLAAHRREAPLSERAWTALRRAAAAVWQYELFSVSESTQVDGRAVTLDYGVTVGKSIGVAGLFVLGWLLARRLTHALVGLLVRHLQLSPQLGKVLTRWLLSLLVVAVLIVVLKLARIPLTAFAFLGGALAIGVGFGTQNIIKNLISGVIILFERKIRIGDIVSIDGVAGTVSSVDLRATTVRGFDGIDAIVPNSQLLENRVSNWSYGSPVVRRSVVVGLRYGSDARQAAAVVRACADADPDVLRTPAPEVLFDDFGPDAQVLRLLYWLRLSGPRPGPTVDSDLRHAISEAFAAHGLVIAYPQRDVHLDVVGPLAVRLQEAGP